MQNLTPLLIVLALASAFGVWHRRTRGSFKTHKVVVGHRFTAAELGTQLGARATMVQFSSAFCAPCRATYLLLDQMVKSMNDVVHVQLDAENNLELVRQLNILSTPTTLFIDRSGVEIGRATGRPTRDQVLAALAQIR